MSQQAASNPQTLARMRARIDDKQGLERLTEIMRCLRDPDGGCPWDLQQDFASIAPFTIEEAYEVADAIESGDLADLKDELGDLLLQVVYHAQMAQEQDAFDLDAVIEAIAAKMERRHPHVFAPATAEEAAPGADIASIRANWEQIKSQERTSKGKADRSILADVGSALPAIMRAEKLQKRVARVGFDWPTLSGISDKIREELEELEQAQAAQDQANIAEEFGDLMFTLVNFGRRLGLSSEEALRQANLKFERRFRALEARLGSLEGHDLDSLQDAWQAVKREEKAKP